MSTGSHYTVLARRFRPQAFDDVVGQEHVSQALRNAIRAGRVAHAYLFSGARGVGKTSSARILAKALNCPNALDGVPCNQCEICDGVSAGNDVDVMEIDGASNNGVENIRMLRANVGVRPMHSTFKIYIIDEVHMLSTAAFNALLKTLEEPPPNVKFVFCTTEPNKVPDTILSRCQRFDFSAIGEESIGKRLQEIAAAEGFEVDPEAIELVARRARGSMRDSQSLFDQLLAFSSGVVKANDVHRMLGTAGDDTLVALFDAIAEHRPGEVLNLLDGALNAGVQAGELLDQCVGYVRDQMVTLSGGATVSLCSVGNSRREAVQQQAQKLGMTNVMAAFQILSEAKNRMLRSTFARILLEMALTQLALLENLSALSSLLSGNLPELPELPGLPAAGGNPASVAPATASAPASSSASNPSAEKKNPEIATAAAPTESELSVESTPSIPLTQENADRLLTEVIAESGFTLSGALRSVSSIAIIGPNGLELQLGSSYDFHRRILEKAENRTAMESTLSRLTGQDVAVALKIVADAVPQQSAAAAEAKRPEKARPVAARKDEPVQVKGPTPLRVRDDIDPEQDAFVQEVVQLFGAKVVRITDAPARKNMNSEDPETEPDA